VLSQPAARQASSSDTSPQSQGLLNAATFSPDRDDVFGRIASRYDLLCDLFSLGIHRYWKRRVAALIASEPWNDLLDAASGTGDIVLRVLNRREPSGSRRVVACDISPPMLAIARRRLARLSHLVELRVMDARSMPEVATNSVDLYTMSFGLKICDRAAVLREAMRVLKPGGRLVILEASNIRFEWMQRAYLRYMSICMPVIGWLATGGDASAYRYLLQGIHEFPTAERLAEEIRDFGFREVFFQRLSLGIVAIHTARKQEDENEDPGRARTPG
jgi:demethylmenaquinone methyltransferase / 2-methoxy-6-polyprenyl-1,4-benzoquinol methylase